MKPDVLTAEMHRKSFLMSFPQSLKLYSEKPANIRKELEYADHQRYATVTAGQWEPLDF